MPDFNEAACDLFINSCDTKYSQDALIRMVIGVDAEGCPYVKTNGPTAAQTAALTAAIVALTAAIEAM